jgi:hypothetical protein
MNLTSYSPAFKEEAENSPIAAFAPRAPIVLEIYWIVREVYCFMRSLFYSYSIKVIAYFLGIETCIN